MPFIIQVMEKNEKNEPPSPPHKELNPRANNLMLHHCATEDSSTSYNLWQKFWGTFLKKKKKQLF